MRFFRSVLYVALCVFWSGAHSQASEPITVYKSPYCGCCSAWGHHLEENGFQVTYENRDDMDLIKKFLGVPQRLASCHTAVVGDYVIEGHVPAQDILSLLKDRPEAKGLSVPGMPIGSPGMEQGDQKDPYDVILFNQEGQSAVFSSYPKTDPVQ